MNMPPEIEARVKDVTCDLCGRIMPVPPHAIAAGEILGLLVCTACIEDNLSATANEPRAALGMVGSGGQR